MEILVEISMENLGKNEKQSSTVTKISSSIFIWIFIILNKL